MQLLEFVRDDEGVSPVIGVILMVAITVILAAVIGAFVLNTNPDTEKAPNVNWDYKYTQNPPSGGDPKLEISHNGGDRVEGDRLRVVADGMTKTPWSSMTYVTGGTTKTITDSALTPGTTVRIVWNAEQSTQSNTIGSYELP